MSDKETKLAIARKKLKQFQDKRRPASPIATTTTTTTATATATGASVDEAAVDAGRVLLVQRERTRTVRAVASNPVAVEKRLAVDALAAQISHSASLIVSHANNASLAQLALSHQNTIESNPVTSISTIQNIPNGAHAIELHRKASAHSKDAEINILKDVIRGTASLHDFSMFDPYQAQNDRHLDLVDALKACNLALLERIKKLENDSDASLKQPRRSIETQTWEQLSHTTSDPLNYEALLKQKDSSIRELAQMNAEMRIELERVKSGKEGDEEQTDPLNERVQTLEKLLKDSERRYSLCKQELEALQSVVRELPKETTESETRTSESTDAESKVHSLEAANKKLVLAVDSLRSELEETTSTLQSQLSSTSAALVQANTTISILTAESLVTNKENDRLKSQLSLAHQLQESPESFHPPEDVLIEINRVKRAAALREREFEVREEQLHSQLQSLRHKLELTALQSDSDTKQGVRLEELQKENQALHHELAMHKHHYHHTPTSISAANVASMEELEKIASELDHSIEVNSKLQTRVNELELSIMTRDQNHAAQTNLLKRQYEASQTHALELKGLLNALQLTKSDQQRQHIERLGALEAEKESLIATVSNLEDLLASAHKALDLKHEKVPDQTESNSQLVESKPELLELEREIEHLKSVIASLSEDLEASNAKHFDLTKQLKQRTKDFQTKYDNLYNATETVSKTMYEKHVSQLQFKLDSLQHQHEVFKDRFHSSQARAQALLDNLMRAEAELARLRLSQADIGSVILEKGQNATNSDIINTLQEKNNGLASEVLKLRKLATENEEELEALKRKLYEKATLAASVSEVHRELEDARSQLTREREMFTLKERSLYTVTETLRQSHQSLQERVLEIKRAIWETGNKHLGWNRGQATERVEDIDILKWVNWMCNATRTLELDLEETHQVLDMQHEKMETVMANSSVAGSVAAELVSFAETKRLPKHQRSFSRLDDVSSSSSNMSALINWSKNVGEATASSIEVLNSAGLVEDEDGGQPGSKDKRALKKLLHRNVLLQQQLESLQSQLNHQLATNVEIKRMLVGSTVGTKDARDEDYLSQYNDALIEIGELRREVDHWRSKHDEMETVVENAVLERIAQNSKEPRVN